MNKLKQSERKALKLLCKEGSFLEEGIWHGKNSKIMSVTDGWIGSIQKRTFYGLVEKKLIQLMPSSIDFVITESGREAAIKGYYE